MRIAPHTKIRDYYPVPSNKYLTDEELRDKVRETMGLYLAYGDEASLDLTRAHLMDLRDRVVASSPQPQQ